jgi:hypothetical protein
VVFVVDKVALGQVFSEYFRFPCQFSFHRLLHNHHHLSSGAGTIGQLVADVPSGLSLTPSHETKKKLIKKAHTTTTAAGSRLLPCWWLQKLKISSVHQQIENNRAFIGSWHNSSG